jgi:hypothetical protein
MNQVHTLMLFFKIILNIILPSLSRPHKWSLSFRFQVREWYYLWRSLLCNAPSRTVMSSF